MEQVSELTYRILAYSELNEVDSNEAIDWASEMIDLGFESPHLFMLASFSKPTTYYEVIDYVTKSIAELGLEMKAGKAAIVSYAAYYVLQLSKEIRVRENLELLYRFCQKMDYERSIYDFYMLNWAWDDFDNGLEHTPYWGVTKETISRVVVEEAKKWLQENRLLIEPKFAG